MLRKLWILCKISAASFDIVYEIKSALDVGTWITVSLVACLVVLPNTKERSGQNKWSNCGLFQKVRYVVPKYGIKQH